MREWEREVEYVTEYNKNSSFFQLALVQFYVNEMVLCIGLNWTTGLYLLIRASCYFTCIVDFLCDFFSPVRFRATESNLYLSFYAPQYNNYSIEVIFHARHEHENVMQPLEVFGIDFVFFFFSFSVEPKRAWNWIIDWSKNYLSTASFAQHFGILFSARVYIVCWMEATNGPKGKDKDHLQSAQKNITIHANPCPARRIRSFIHARGVGTVMGNNLFAKIES